MKRFLPILALLVLQAPAGAFSPYENQLAAGDAKRIGLIAMAGGDDEALGVALAALPGNDPNTLEAAGIRNLHVYLRKLPGQSFVFAYFEFRGADHLHAGQALAKASAPWRALAKLVRPHPRAAARGLTWLPMECIARVATDAAYPHQNPKPRRLALMSGLKPDKEALYRSLHQTTWPGVSDAMARSNYRNWTTFLVDSGDRLFLFTYFEYLGDDLDADNKAMAADPVTQRWWKHTEPCLIPLTNDGNWIPMPELSKGSRKN